MQSHETFSSLLVRTTILGEDRKRAKMISFSEQPPFITRGEAQMFADSGPVANVCVDTP